LNDYGVRINTIYRGTVLMPDATAQLLKLCDADFSPRLYSTNECNERMPR